MGGVKFALIPRAFDSFQYRYINPDNLPPHYN